MPGNCPASLRPIAARLWKTFRSKPNAIPVTGENCSPSHGIVFTFPPECCSESQRNGVQLQNGIAFTFVLAVGTGSPRCKNLLHERREHQIGTAIRAGKCVVVDLELGRASRHRVESIANNAKDIAHFQRHPEQCR